MSQPGYCSEGVQPMHSPNHCSPATPIEVVLAPARFSKMSYVFMNVDCHAYNQGATGLNWCMPHSGT